MSRFLRPPKFDLANLSIGMVLLGMALFGFSLDRYPLFYVDDAFFAYPALRAATGNFFTYPVSMGAPFGSELWAYHGPAYPQLLRLLFHLFGFSTVLTRLPDFLGGWLAVLLLVIGLKKKGYRYAGFALAILWWGDRSNQEVMYGRMDGLALLCLVVAFLCLEAIAGAARPRAVLLCGFLCGLAMLLNPLCILFLIVAGLLVAYLRSRRECIWFVAGAAANLALLLPLWGFRIQAPVAQFIWHARQLQGSSAASSFGTMLRVLQWSRYWFVALLLFSMVGIAFVARELLTSGRKLDRPWREFLVPCAFTLASFGMIFRPSTHPYYIVYFALWPMLCLAILVERNWQQMRPWALAMALIWCSSMAWNAFRLRESFLFHTALSRQFLDGQLNRVVPQQATVLVTPELYGVPLHAGHGRFVLTTWFPEQQDICRECYVLLRAEEYRKADYIQRNNLLQRRILYSGPAFPRAKALQYPILLLSPTQR